MLGIMEAPAYIGKGNPSGPRGTKMIQMDSAPETLSKLRERAEPSLLGGQLRVVLQDSQALMEEQEMGNGRG